MFAKTKIPLLALACLAASVASYGDTLHPRLGVGILGVSATLGLGDDGDDSSATSSSFTLPPGGPFVSTPPSFSITPTRTRTSSSSFTSTPTTTTSSSSSSSESSTKASTWTSKFTTSSTKPVTTTVVTTSGGSPITDVVTSSKVVASTGTKTGTTLPQLNGDGGGDDDGGLSDDNIKVIAGVVGGVGGALVIGIIVFVVWRLKVKARRSEEQEDLMAGQENSLKYSSPAATATTSSPFTSTLDQYHNPGGRVNPSSNF